MDEARWMDLAIEAGQLREAMVHRADIEQAKGIIMALRRCTPDAAFRELNTVSQRNNIKLVAIAGALVQRVSPTAMPLEEDDPRLSKLVFENWLGGLAEAAPPPLDSDAARAW